MTLRVTVLALARIDAESIYEWIRRRSETGAAAWYASFETVIRKIANEADSAALAPESDLLGIPLRQRLFRTRHGRRYRVLFTVKDNEVCVLRVRGPGQPPVGTSDLPEI
jgi:plasmid stabilization system protein ParE